MFGRKPEHILVVKTDGLAAFVAAEPSFESIRQSHPGARISLLTSDALHRVAKASPYFDQVAVLPSLKEPEARKVFIKQLKTEKFSRVYDLAGDAGSKKLAAAMGLFRPKWFSADPPKLLKSKILADTLPDLAKMVGEAGLAPAQRLPDFSWALAARKDSANMRPAWFGISGPFGLLLPGLDPKNRWDAEKYGEFARLIVRDGMTPVIAGQRALHHFADKVSHLAPEVVDLVGKTDHLQLAALAHEANFFVSDQADEVHLAVSAGCSGILIKRKGHEGLSPQNRHVVTLTVNQQLNEAHPSFVLRTLDNMLLTPNLQIPAPSADFQAREAARQPAADQHASASAAGFAGARSGDRSASQSVDS